MLMQISLKLLQGRIQRAIADATVLGRCEIFAQLADGSQALTGCIMFSHHHCDRILYVAKRRERRWSLLGNCRLQTRDIRKENTLFLHHVRLKLYAQSLKPRSNVQKLRMVLAMSGTDFFEQCCQAFKFVTCKDVMFFDD